ncbi:MAG TPA: beta-ketoacyl synthase N-terminal-like domain-containing protein [Actinocrinis sp.]|nr:beta-ketoacyl synthase N-terminal-like domain-containing protein [Actinocrinis sp.]
MTVSGVGAARTAPRILARAAWPEGPGDTLPAVPGFILSTFNPLVVEVAERCLTRVFPPPPLRDPARAARVGILLASAGGDRGTARALAEAVERGGRVPPLLFFQSNPNAVLGHVTARWGLAGPVVCVSPAPAGGPLGAALAEAMTVAAALIGDGDADEVLVIAAEQGTEPGGSTGPVGAGAGGAGKGAGLDSAVALFVTGE